MSERLTAGVDVVIVNYNSGQALEQCLKLLTQDSVAHLNICVVDNRSSDGSERCVETINEKLNQKITLICNDSNAGFAVACNQGSQTGKATKLAFINPDCFISPQQILQLSEQLEQHSDAALIGCRVLNEDGSLQAASRRRLPTFWRIIWHLTGLSKLTVLNGININDSGEFDTIQQVEAVNGACIIIKRNVFDALGRFDEAYRLHFEDLDLFARLQARKYSILYDASVSVEHLKGHSSQQNQLIKNWKKQGLLRYLSKHRPRWEYRLAKFFLGSK